MPGQSGDDDLVRTVVEAAVDELDARAGHLADLVAATGGSLTAFSGSADMFQTLRKPSRYKRVSAGRDARLRPMPRRFGLASRLT